MINSIRKIFCHHEHLEFIRNLYCDDEFWLGRVFECMNCHKKIYKDCENRLMEAPLNQSARLLIHKPK